MAPKAAAQAAKAVNRKAKADEDKTKQQRKQETEQDEDQDEDEEMDDGEPQDGEDEDGEEDGEDEEEDEEEGSDEDADEEDAKAGTKRKDHPTNDSKVPAKQQRQSNGKANGHANENTATSKQILNFLMSKDAIPLCFPDDEVSSGMDKSYALTPPNLFTPYEHLVTAILLSKPLSHKLGMRSIRTLLNKSYNFSTPGTMYEAGEHQIWEALEKARTQHRQKTAKQLFDLAESFQDSSKKTDEGDADDSSAMHELLEKANDGGSKATIDFVKSSVNGLGDVGAQIFCRRVQACDGWGKALWPFADQKSLDSVKECGIDVKNADELEDMIERDLSWDKIGTMGLHKEKEAVRQQDGEVQVAVEFVTLLERAIGCVLEGNVEELKKQAAAKA